MQSTAFLISSFVPLIVLFALWQLSKKWNKLFRLIAITLGLLLSFPIGLAGVAASLHQSFARGVEHNPGAGVANIPLLVVWVVCVLVSLGGAFLGLMRSKAEPT